MAVVEYNSRAAFTTSQCSIKARDMVEKVPFFHAQNDSFIATLILTMNLEICAPYDVIIQEGDIGHCMYFLRRGLVEVVSGDGDTIYTTLSDGAFFGEVSLLVSGRRTASIRAVTHCDLLRLEQEDLNKVLLDYPEAMHRITQLAADNKYQLSEKDKRVLRSRFEMMQEQMTHNSSSDEGEYDHDRESSAGEHELMDGASDRRLISSSNPASGNHLSDNGNRLLKRGNSRRDVNTLNFYDIVDALKEKRHGTHNSKSRGSE